jgi:hypothetical protein
MRTTHVAEGGVNSDVLEGYVVLAPLVLIQLTLNYCHMCMINYCNCFHLE